MTHNGGGIAVPAADPEKERRQRKAAYMRAWLAKNRERVTARNRELHAAGKWKVRKAYRVANRDKVLAKAKEWKDANRDHVRAQNRQHYHDHRDVYIARAKVRNYIRKAQKRHNGPSESFSRKEIYDRDEWTCHLCGLPVDPSLSHPDPMSASLDHVKPLVKGGCHTRDNVACSHLRCNISKKHLFETKRSPALAG